MTYAVRICLSSEGKWYVLWLWMYATYVVSIIAVASYYCNMCIHDMSICIEPSRWKSHITISECSWVRLVRKLYDYSGVLATCWLRPYRYSIVRCSRRGTMQLHTLLGTETVDMYMHCICTLWDLFCIEVLCWHKVDMRSIVFIYIRSIVLFICGWETHPVKKKIYWP